MWIELTTSFFVKRKELFYFGPGGIINIEPNKENKSVLYYAPVTAGESGLNIIVDEPYEYILSKLIPKYDYRRYIKSMESPCAE